MRRVGTMTLQECYEKMGGNYEDVISRLTKEERITKYTIKFLEDTTFQSLCEAREAKDHEAVFREIHTLKGVSQNLGFTKLYEACHVMTEAVRGGVELQEESLFEAVSAVYFKTIEVIKEYAVSIGK